tara:strand:- start:866 stop:1582 length:717 start_codon:yes stop_codon:yes gene_type:complete
MNLACIDIGNTNIVIGFYKDNKLVNVKRFETDKNEIIKNIDFKNIKSIAISSVVPEIEKFILSKISTSCFNISFINSNINLDIESPSEVGNDRICNMKVVIEKKLYPAIIVDFGSATTYDVINDIGHFIGGAIAPGVDVSAQNLFKKAAQLNKVDFKIPQSVIGKNTITNLQSGIMYGGIDAINGMLNRIKKEMKGKINNIILTGGFSKILSQYIEHKHTLDPNMTLDGIKLIWEENQ